MTFSRRAFLASAAASAIAPAFGRSLKTIGAQLYTVRTVLPEKPMETLQALEQIGYREAEVSQPGIDKMWPSLLKTKLKPVSIGLDGELLKAGKLDEAIADAKKRGFKYAVYGGMPPADRAGEAEMKRFAAELNRAGMQCRDAGIMLCYHNHAFEFDPKAGKTPMEVLMANTEAGVVGLELDIFWAAVAGHDPSAVLERYSGRVPLLHLKDMAEGTPQGYGPVQRTAFKEVGNGTLDIAKVLRAAQAAGVKHYFVEQDQTPGDPVESLRQSFNNLRKLNF